MTDLPTKALINRDSVCAADDFDAHDLEVSFSGITTGAQLVRHVHAAANLPLISGGRATWVLTSDGPLAVAAQEWGEPRLALPDEDVFAKVAEEQGVASFHWDYRAQEPPEAVLAELRSGVSLADVAKLDASLDTLARRYWWFVAVGSLVVIGCVSAALLHGVWALVASMGATVLLVPWGLAAERRRARSGLVVAPAKPWRVGVADAEVNIEAGAHDVRFPLCAVGKARYIFLDSLDAEGGPGGALYLEVEGARLRVPERAEGFGELLMALEDRGVLTRSPVQA